MADPKKYWATLQGRELLQELNARTEEYYSFLESSGRLRRWRLAYTNYYGNDNLHSTTEVQAGGDSGELNVIKVNDYRNLIQHLLVLTTSNRPAIDCRARNTDVQSQMQAMLGNGIVEYYLRENKFEDKLLMACETALVLEEGFLAFDWDTSLGQELAVDQETGKSEKDGDINVTPLTSLDVIRNPYVENTGDQWKRLRLPVNKYDLMAKYPEKADLISAAAMQSNRNRVQYQDSSNRMSDDIIDTWLFYHERTAAMPDGRAVLSFEDEILYDVKLPYKKIPVERIAPSDMIKQIFGYTPGMDLLGLQQITDALHSTIITNQLRFGVQSIIGPKGADLSVQQLGKGMTYFELDPKFVDLLRPLQLTSTPKEIFEYVGMVEKKGETLSGVNSVSRGNPEASLKSGSALALVQSMSVQFNSGLIAQYTKLIEGTGNTIIQFLQQFARSPRIAAIAGKNNRYMLKQFTSDDISGISRVTCDSANPLSKTLAGRVELADKLMGNQMIKRPEQYITLLQTGRWEPLMDNEMSQLLTIQAEREALLEGQPVQALITDDHPQHVIEHTGILSSPESRQDPALTQRTLAHIMEHIQLDSQMDPRLRQMLGMPPIPVMPTNPDGTAAPMPPPPGGPQGPAPQAPPHAPPHPQGHEQGGNGPIGPAPGAPSSVGGPGGPAPARQPNGPVNPLTHQRVATPTK